MRDELIFTIYFEFFGKKMKTKIEAKSRQEAIEIVKNRIHVIDIQAEISNPFDSLFNRFK